MEEEEEEEERRRRRRKGPPPCNELSLHAAVSPPSHFPFSHTPLNLSEQLF